MQTGFVPWLRALASCLGLVPWPRVCTRAWHLDVQSWPLHLPCALPGVVYVRVVVKKTLARRVPRPGQLSVLVRFALSRSSSLGTGYAYVRTGLERRTGTRTHETECGGCV